MLESSRFWCGTAFVLATGLLVSSQVAERNGSVLRVARAPQIAFASHRDGNWEIYLTDADGQNQTRLTRSDPQDRFPLWSPDRSRIAFGSQVGGDHWELWVVNVDGTNPRFLATDIVAKGHRQWSHDGRRIVFSATVDDNVDVFVVDVATGKLTRLTNSPGDDADPAWSPDDRHIAFSSSRDGNPEIYVMRADGTDPRRLTNDAAPDRSPDWSPDGTRIAFVSRAGAGDAYVVHLADGRRERLTVDAHATNDGARWSASGEYIAVQTSAGSYDIQIIRMSDRERRTIGSTASYDGQFSWSSSGDQLAFISERDGFNALYVTDVAGNQRQLTTSLSLNPEWSPP
jgi:tol-pal system beta propeller repeat protein TolB